MRSSPPAALGATVGDNIGYRLAVAPPHPAEHAVTVPITRGGSVNWKLILKLSLFGLAMGIATVFVISSSVEPWLWLVVLGISAYVIATRISRRYFVHGLLVGMANSVWVTASHILLFDSYVAHHPRYAAMMTTTPAPGSPRMVMALIGPVIGVLSGLALGVLAVVAGKLVRRRAAPGH